jgi:hypothetical protein
MKKKMLLIAMALAALVALSFVGCAKDSGDDVDADIVGTWKPRSAS